MEPDPCLQGDELLGQIHSAWHQGQMPHWQTKRQALLACCKPLLTTPPSAQERISSTPLSPNNSIQRCWSPQLTATEGRKGVSCVALLAHLSKQELLAAQQKQKEQGTPSSTAASVCNACFLVSLVPLATRHKSASVALLLPFYHSITSIVPIIPLQKDQVMRRKPEILHIVACQSTSVTAVIHSIKIFNPKGRHSPLEQFTTALAPWWSEFGKQLKNDIH